MPKFLADILKCIVALVPFLIEAEVSASPGADKKAFVIAQINGVLDEPGGVDLPSWISGDFRRWLLGLLVDVLVRILSKTGFFAKSSAP
ncbi:MAG: hypothetical protein ACH37Z_18790 [Anaerolineae bacterium]